MAALAQTHTSVFPIPPLMSHHIVALYLLMCFGESRVCTLVYNKSNYLELLSPFLAAGIGF